MSVPTTGAAAIFPTICSKILIEGYCDWKGTPAYNKSQVIAEHPASSSTRDLDRFFRWIERFHGRMATPNADSLPLH